MTAGPLSQQRNFDFLDSFWPDLYALADEAKMKTETEPTLAVIRLRSLAEAMVVHLLKHADLPLVPYERQIDRLKVLQSAGHLDARVSGIFHIIRKLGNDAAHGGSVLAEHAKTLIEDAWSLASWFCRYMRPDVDWDTPRSNSLLQTNGTLDTWPRRTNAHVVLGQETIASRAQIDLEGCPRTRLKLSEFYGTELNEDQKNCVSALDVFLADDRQRVFLLKGYAGTGKTFLAAGLSEFLLAQGRTFSLAAPTGRAAKVIAAKTAQSAATLHSLIYDYSHTAEDVEDGEDASKKFRMIGKVAQNEAPINKVYIVDESSLVSNIFSESEFFRSGSGHLLRDLIDFVGSARSGNRRKIIFIGDPAQLTPVGMSTSPALDEDYLRQTFGLEVTGCELTEIVRQKAESAVLRNVMPLRESLAHDRFSSLLFSFDDDVIRLKKERVTEHYMTIRQARGPEAPIIVTYSNAEAAAFNRAIRAQLFPGQDFVAAGDIVMVAANGLCGTHYIANGEMLRIESVEPEVERRSVRLRERIGETDTFEYVNVDLCFRDVRVAIPQLDEQDLIISAKILDDFLHGNDASLDRTKHRALYVDFVQRHEHIDRKTQRDEFLLALRADPYFHALKLRFGYAITCHKAQGGEWTHVIVSCATKRNPRSADYFRWLYTAMTRTSGKLYLVDPPESKLKAAGGPGGGWETPIRPEHHQQQVTPVLNTLTPEACPNRAERPPLSQRDAFRHWLMNLVQAQLSGANIDIEDVAHHQYREAYFFKRGTAYAQIDFSYKGDWTVSRVSCPRPDTFSDEVSERLTPITGRKPSRTALGFGPVSEPSRLFLKNYHNRLVAALAPRGISVADLKEQVWSQRYTLERGGDVVEVDISFNGKEQVGKWRPVNPMANPGSALVELQDDVREVMTQVNP